MRLRPIALAAATVGALALACGGQTAADDGSDDVQGPGAEGCKTVCDEAQRACNVKVRNCAAICLRQLRKINPSEACGLANDDLVRCQAANSEINCDGGGGFGLPEACEEANANFNCPCIGLCPAECGNGIKEVGEMCDRNDFGARRNDGEPGEPSGAFPMPRFRPRQWRSSYPSVPGTLPWPPLHKSKRSSKAS